MIIITVLFLDRSYTIDKMRKGSFCMFSEEINNVAQAAKKIIITIGILKKV